MKQPRKTLLQRSRKSQKLHSLSATRVAIISRFWTFKNINLLNVHYVQTADGKAPVSLQYVVHLSAFPLSQYHYREAASVSSQADSWDSDFLGWRVGGGRSPEQTALHQRGSEPLPALRLTALQYATFSALFICSVMTPPPSQEGLSFHL